jgi:hypothetical protein
VNVSVVFEPAIGNIVSPASEDSGGAVLIAKVVRLSPRRHHNSICSPTQLQDH